MARVTDKERDDAVLICEIRASTQGTVSNHVVGRAIGASQHAINLSLAAWCAVADRHYKIAERDARGGLIDKADVESGIEAEAATLIRSGWCDGDPVEALSTSEGK